MLIDEGKIKLNDLINQYLPEELHFETPITILYEFFF